jgi:hypothetical protein
MGEERFAWQRAPLLLYSAILFVASLFGIADIAVFQGARTACRPAARGKTPLWESLVIRSANERCGVIAVHRSRVSGICHDRPDDDAVLPRTSRTFAHTNGVVARYRPRHWHRAVGSDVGTHRQGARDAPMLRFRRCSWWAFRLWLLATKNNAWLVGAAIALSGAMVTAYEIANLQFITRACPHLPRPTITALFWLVLGLSFAFGSTMGGWVAHQLIGWHWRVGGFDFVNYQVVFAFRFCRAQRTPSGSRRAWTNPTRPDPRNRARSRTRRETRSWGKVARRWRCTESGTLVLGEL